MSDWLRNLQQRWRALGAREQRALRLGALVVALALGWSLLLAPALRVLRGADQQGQRLAQTLDRMQALQAQAQALRAQPQVSSAAIEALVRQQVEALGPGASVARLGDQCTITLRQVDAALLARWLAGGQPAGRPSALHLQRDAASGGAVTWSGSAVVQLAPSGH